MQSIYITLDTLTTETSVPAVKDKDGNLVRKNMGMVPMELRREDWPTSDQFEDEAKLLQWCQEKGVLHQCLQSGISDRLIDYRAIFKAMPKKADLDAGARWTVEFGQNNIDRAEWQVQKRPNQAGSKAVTQARYNDCIAAIAASTQNGMKADQIKTIFEPIYGQEMVAAIMKELKALKK